MPLYPILKERWGISDNFDFCGSKWALPYKAGKRDQMPDYYNAIFLVMYITERKTVRSKLPLKLL
jgi:hypothetical protein